MYARVAVHRDWAACRAVLDGEKDPHARRYFALTTKATRSLYDARFAPGDVFVFGCETTVMSPLVVCSSRETSALRRRLSWVSSAPFGVPVVPDV